MPLTPHGERMLARLGKEYGPDKAKQVFYASINAKKPGFAGSEPSNAMHRRLKRNGR